ncbi:MAG: hypothetical protein LBO69_05330 [Ignavibacteria bacterium]|jgi:hypothetical protein|nr:hypothetical protein [Ignavibacteria bacterium]
MKKQFNLLLFVLLAIFACSSAFSQIPRKINFQAYLVDANNVPVQGSVYIVAKIYDQPIGGALQFTDELHPFAVNGIINDYIGNNAQNPLPPTDKLKFDRQYFLELQVNNGMIAERIPLSASTYALGANWSLVADSAAWAAKVAPNSINGTNITAGAIYGTHIQDGTITSEKLDSMASYRWRGMHTFIKTGVQMVLNDPDGYAIRIIEGTLKARVIVADSISTTSINTNNLSIGTGNAAYKFPIAIGNADQVLRLNDNKQLEWAYVPFSEVYANGKKQHSVPRWDSIGGNLQLNAGSIMDDGDAVSIGKPLYIDSNNITMRDSKLFFSDKVGSSKAKIELDTNGIFIGNHIPGSAVSTPKRGIIFKDSVLSYTISPTFTNASAFENVIVTKKYVDDKDAIINNRIDAVMDTVAKMDSEKNDITTSLTTPNKLITWDGGKFANTGVTYVTANKILRYDAAPTFTNANANSIITKKYVDDKEALINDKIDAVMDTIIKMDSVKNNLTTSLTDTKLITWDGGKFANTGVSYTNGLLRYDAFPTIPLTAADSSIVITKKYVDSKFNEVSDSVLAESFSDLHSQYIPYWDGSKLVNSKIMQSNDSSSLTIGNYDNVQIGNVKFATDTTPSHATSISGITSIVADNILTNIMNYYDGYIDLTTLMPKNPTQLTLTTKGYVDNNVAYAMWKAEDALGQSFYNLHSTYLPYWNGTKLVDSKIRQLNNLITIGVDNMVNSVMVGSAMFDVDNASNPTTSLRNLNTIATRKLESDFIGTDRIDYWGRFLDGSTKMPYDANEYTLASKGYVDNNVNYLVWRLENDWINGERIYDGTISAYKIQNHSIWSNHIADNAILTRHINDWAVTNQKLSGSSVDERVLANNSVTNQKIQDQTITGDKLQDYTITWRQLAANSVTKDKLSDFAVGPWELEDNAVIERTIANANVTHDKIAHNAIDAVRLQANAVTTEKIQDYAVTDNKLWVSKIDYRGTLAANDFMPGGATATTLTTKQYVDNRLSWNDTLKSNSADISALTLINYNSEPTATALKIDSGRVVLGYVQTNSCNLQGMNNYSVINITAGPPVNQQINLPDNTVTELGQILYVINSSGVNLRFCCITHTSGEWIAPGEAATFVCGMNGTTKTWFRIR